MPTIQGWFANDKQFEMGPFFEVAEGIRRFQIASPSIIGIRVMQASYQMIEEAGMAAISAKAAAAPRSATGPRVCAWAK